MYQCVVMNSEYCSMGRWISVIVAKKLNMKLYETKDLLAFVDEEWLTETYLRAFEKQLRSMTLEEAKANKEVLKVHSALTKAILKVVELGPCIIHEGAASEILKDVRPCLKVLLYNTNMAHRIPRARADKTYPIQDMSDEQIISFIKQTDHSRKVYHNAVSSTFWGEKESYDICLDSDILGREKCAEILIKALQPVALNLDACQKAIEEAFSWSK